MITNVHTQQHPAVSHVPPESLIPTSTTFAPVCYVLHDRLLGTPAFITGEALGYTQLLQRSQSGTLSAFSGLNTWEPAPLLQSTSSQHSPSEAGFAINSSRLSPSHFARSPSGAFSSHGSAVGVGGGIGPLGRNSLMAASFIGLHHPDLGQRQLDKESMSHGAGMLGDDEDPDRCVATRV